MQLDLLRTGHRGRRSGWMNGLRAVLLASTLLIAGACGSDTDGTAGPSSSGGAGGHAGSGGGSGGTSAGGGSGGATGGTGGGSGGTGGTAFTCTEASTSSPALAALFLLDPKDPHPGDTLTVVIRATNGVGSGDAPPMTLGATSAKGTSDVPLSILIGGPATYVYEVPDVPLGDICLLSKVNGADEASGKVTVTPRPPGPSAQSGVYKVTENHQFTCDEQPDWGNELHVEVRDAAGNGVPNAKIDVRLPDWTDLGSIKNADTNPVPSELATDGSGHYDDYFWWPSNDNGFTIFELTVQGTASDRATEITSGWWQSDPSGCTYCNGGTAHNVYGHWSHRIVFQLDASATEACVVPTDHAGQSACGAPGHVQHDPGYSACWSVK
jgi:hypothetical protein